MSGLSKYADSWPFEAKVRYQAKILLIGGVDLFSCGELGVATNDVLSFTPRFEDKFLTMKQFKARKGLEAYNQFGKWLGEECVYTKSARKIPVGRVCYSN